MSTTKINIILFGIETLGSALIKQILNAQAELLATKNIELTLPIITNSTVAFFEKPNVKNSWEANFNHFSTPFKINDIINYVQQNEFENLIAIDTTDTAEMISNYHELLQNDFDIISSNAGLEAFSAEFNLSINSIIKPFQSEFYFVNPTKKETTSETILKKITQISQKPTLKMAI